LFEGSANAIAKRLEPVARGHLLIVGLEHERFIASARFRRKRRAYDIVIPTKVRVHPARCNAWP
jgi:hypothetical protein